MIEIVYFGDGYRLDGANWGERALPKLTNGWQPVEPGLHMIDQFPGDAAVHHNLAVLSDGTARLSKLIDPEIHDILVNAGQVRALGLGEIAAAGVRIEASNPMMVFLNIRKSEIVSTGSRAKAFNCLRLVSAVRYNPDSYTPRA